MKIVCLGDTHGQHERVDVPDGDVFLYIGDMCREGTIKEVRAFRDDFLRPLPHPHKVVVAGNHDWPFEDRDDLLPNCTYLKDEAVTIQGTKIYGSPWQPEFCNWAFNLPRGEPLADKWEMIPEDTDILATHGPPHGIMDMVRRGHVGCRELRKSAKDIQPDFHVFGHIHECAGRVDHDITTFMNVSFLGKGDAPYVIKYDSGDTA